MKPSNNKQAAAIGAGRLLCLVGLFSVATSGVAMAATAATAAAAATTSGRSAPSAANEQQRTIGKDDHLQAVASNQAQQSISMPQMTTTTARDLNAGQTNIANAKVQLNNPNDMTAAAGSHYGKSHGGKYYMYVESPKKGAYKMGYKRGNAKHTIMAKASVHGSHVSAYYKWHDKKGKGSHKFELKHSGKKGKKYY